MVIILMHSQFFYEIVFLYPICTEPSISRVYHSLDCFLFVPPNFNQVFIAVSRMESVLLLLILEYN